MTPENGRQYAYLTLPPQGELRSCIGLVMAGMAARAKVGVGGLDEAVALLEDFHAEDAPTRYRFSLAEDGVVAEVEGSSGGWRTVVELVS